MIHENGCAFVKCIIINWNFKCSKEHGGDIHTFDILLEQ